jgi:hypothetical protein
LDFSTAIEVLVGEMKGGGRLMLASGATRLIADATAGWPDRRTFTSTVNVNENLRTTHEMKDENLKIGLYEI